MNLRKNFPAEGADVPTDGKAEAAYLIQLVRSALRSQTPPAPPQGMDWHKLYSVAEQQLLSATVWYALKNLPDCPVEVLQKFRRAYDLALRKELLFEVEHARLFAQFDSQGIDYLPLKGAAFNSLYPARGMRQFADSDILFRRQDYKKVGEVMRALGYAGRAYGDPDSPDVYQKPPVFNFEMHYALFSGWTRYARWFGGAWDMAVKDEGDNRAYHMSDDYAYVYAVAHMCKHYEEGGVGLRAFADLYLLRHSRSLNTDTDRAERYLKEAELLSFAQDAAIVAESLFGDTPADINAETMDYIMSGGAYGRRGTMWGNAVRKKGKVRAVLGLIFPPYARMKTVYPVLIKLPFLLPVMWVVKWFNILLFRRKKISMLARVLRSAEDKPDGDK